MKFLELPDKNDNSIKWLHDFVRRGKGFVSKLPFEEILIDQSSISYDDQKYGISTTTKSSTKSSNENIVKIGGDVSHLLNLNER